MTDLQPFEADLRAALLEMAEAAYASGSFISVLLGAIEFCVERGELAPAQFDLPDDSAAAQAAHLRHIEKTGKWIAEHGNEHSFEADSPLGLAVRSLRFSPMEIERVIGSLKFEGVFESFRAIQQRVLIARENLFAAMAEALGWDLQIEKFNSADAKRVLALKVASNEFNPFADYGFAAYGYAVIQREGAD